ncbi:MAG: hypothetical protein QOG68_2176, partial [Solirubrobacteraceae bacterium]|nr:hypothetical protein [Solirubrobacteraceae bacterium]
FIDGYIYEWECHAAAPGAASVTISSCVLAARDTIGAPPVTSQGPVAATDLGASEDTANGRLCWTASARYSDGTTQSTSGCSLVANSLAGLG